MGARYMYAANTMLVLDTSAGFDGEIVFPSKEDIVKAQQDPAFKGAKCWLPSQWRAWAKKHGGKLVEYT